MTEDRRRILRRGLAALYSPFFSLPSFKHCVIHAQAGIQIRSAPIDYCPRFHEDMLNRRRDEKWAEAAPRPLSSVLRPLSSDHDKP